MLSHLSTILAEMMGFVTGFVVTGTLNSVVGGPVHLKAHQVVLLLAWGEIKRDKERARANEI